MPVPDFQSLMLPLLQFSSTQTETSTREAVDFLSKKLNLSEEDVKELLPSGIQTTFLNRVGWASTYMKKAGLLESTRRGRYRITPAGNEVLAKKPEKIDIQFLQQLPVYQEYQDLVKNRRNEKKTKSMPVSNQEEETPTEALERAYENLKGALATELLEKLKSATPSFFEKIVVDLLVAMGYGGSLIDAGKAIGKSGDGGIDGIIKEDKLGLDVLYIQAKRWGSCPVGRPDVMQFAGALQGQKANKGIFITTSRFTEDARNYVSQIASKIVLIDGEDLCLFMIDHNVGVTTVSNYFLKKIDFDYFNEEI